VKDNIDLKETDIELMLDLTKRFRKSGDVVIFQQIRAMDGILTVEYGAMYVNKLIDEVAYRIDYPNNAAVDKEVKEWLSDD